MRYRVILIVAFLAMLGFIGLVGIVNADQISQHEAESFTRPSSVGILSDPSASGGQYLTWGANNATISKSVTFASAVDQIVVRTTADNCSGWPHFWIKVDGVTVATANATSQWITWQDQAFAVNITSGPHTVSLAQDNYKKKGSCFPRLYLDRFTFNGPAPQPTPTPGSGLGCTASTTWCGTYNDTWQSWDGFNGVPNGYIGGFGFTTSQSPYFTFASTPVAEGSSSFKAVVDTGAVTPGQAGQRALIYLFPNVVASSGKTAAYQGSDQWYRSQLRFPANFVPVPSTSFNWVIEWHNWPDGPCCANLSMGVVTNAEDGGAAGGERLSLRILGGGSASNPATNSTNANNDPSPTGFVKNWYQGPTIQRDHWYDVLVRVKWDYTSVGHVDWFLDGQQITSYDGPTLFYYADNNSEDSMTTPGPGQSYFMEGYYRPDVSQAAATVYHDAAVRGPTRVSVGG